MKLKNITGTIFSFEGVTIKAGQESEELKPEVGQRLLALYYGKFLMPSDNSVYKSDEENANESDAKKEPEKGTVDAATGTEAKEFKCPNHPAKTFSTEAKLKAHQRLADKPKEEKTE
jgi:hypothetical protein